MEDVAATDGETIDHGDDGLRETADLHLDIEHVEARHAIGTHVAAAPLDIHVATSAEGDIACAREDYDADILRLAAVAERLAHLPRCERRESIAPTRAVDGDLGDVVELLEKDLLKVETLYFMPFPVHVDMCV